MAQSPEAVHNVGEAGALLVWQFYTLSPPSTPMSPGTHPSHLVSSGLEGAGDRTVF